MISFILTGRRGISSGIQAEESISLLDCDYDYCTGLLAYCKLGLLCGTACARALSRIVVVNHLIDIDICSRRNGMTRQKSLIRPKIRSPNLPSIYKYVTPFRR
jgi:hypothetical protein